MNNDKNGLNLKDENIIVLSTHNPGKLREFEGLQDKFGLRIITRDEAGIPHDYDVVEDGTTFEENSFKKANEIMKLSGLPTMADDSGLMVDCLDGKPGVYSSRFGGVEGDAVRNYTKLLEMMEGVEDGRRTAHFTTVITLVRPDGTVLVAKGECHGRITTEPRGDRGFGYDPVFVPDGYDKTFAELGEDIKNGISHRAMALIKLEKMLEEEREEVKA